MKYILLFILFSAFQFSFSIEFEGRVNKGIIEFDQLDENSGMVVGIENPEIIWSINDGNSNDIYGFDKNGKMVSILHFKKKLLQDNSDIEDIAICKIDGISYLLLSDTGDNDENRDKHFIYFIPEATNDLLEPEVKIDDSDIITIEFDYDDGPHDAECLMADPISKNLYIITKREKYARLYELEYPYKNNEHRTFKFKHTFEFGNNIDLGYTSVTGGDISKDGKNILVRDYTNVWYFHRDEKQSISDALNSTPQKVSAYSYSMSDEPQGESICWENYNQGFYTASEEKKISGFDASLFYFKAKGTGVVKKKEELIINDNYIVNPLPKSIHLTFFNYIGQVLYRIKMEPFSKYYFSNLPKEAHYLFINEYKSYYKLTYVQ